MGSPAPTITKGTRYGHLELTGVYIPGRKPFAKGYIEATVECKCDCGSITYKKLGCLKNGGTKSCSKRCSCYVQVTHGLSMDENSKITKEYMAWNSMKRLCDNPNHEKYKYYGGKGITYHESLATIKGFWEVMGAAPSKYHKFCRIDKQGDYEPGNVHWYLAEKRAKK